MANKANITPEIYQANIPKNCDFQTLKQHKDMLLCWGLLAAIENNRVMCCGICELNTDNKKEGSHG